MAFGLFKKKNKESKDDRYLTLTIREVVPIAQEAVNLVFEKPNEKFSYQPGQFLTLIDEVDGQKIRRAYSLCCTPYLDEFLAVTVKRVPGGRMSNHVNDHYKAGQQVQVMEPMGMFTTTFDQSNTRKAVFIGGGSGITPLISIIRTLISEEPKSRMVLIYGNRSEEYIIFKDLIQELVSKYSDRFKVIHILEEDPNGYGQLKGRPSAGIISDLVRDYTDAEYYICGPQPMMDVAVEGLKLAGVADNQVRMESFEAGKTSPKHSEDSGTSTAQVSIVLDGETHLVQVAMDSPILQTALDAGLDMPYSCQSGLCTACRGKCLEGDISTDEAEGLSPQELEEGYRLLCVGKPLTETVKVEVG